jgi:hypothetical protein
LPSDPIRFLLSCIRRGRVLWTYPVNMRLAGRILPPEFIFGAAETFELVEIHPDKKYPPSYFVLGRAGTEALHVLVTVDVERDTVRIVTADRRDAGERLNDSRTRRPKP